MIYPWYDEGRWLSERFKGDPQTGHRRVEAHSPFPAAVHYRDRYASFRVNGLEYARMTVHGRISCGVKKAPLTFSLVPPEKLVGTLKAMFALLAERAGDINAAQAWADKLSPPELAHFIKHVARHHQPEHWLESILVEKISLLGSSLEQAKSQILIGDREHASRSNRPRFVDLVALDNRERLVWLIELKVPKATGRAVSQAADYASWVRGKLDQLLEPASGYFAGISDSTSYRVAIAFVAPCFTSDFAKHIEDRLKGFPVRTMEINADWRAGIKVSDVDDYQF
jgi:hypothetical protein